MNLIAGKIYNLKWLFGRFSISLMSKFKICQFLSKLVESYMDRFALASSFWKKKPSDDSFVKNSPISQIRIFLYARHFDSKKCVTWPTLTSLNWIFFQNHGNLHRKPWNTSGKTEGNSMTFEYVVPNIVSFDFSLSDFSFCLIPFFII
jgi:hypothetical protein